MSAMFTRQHQCRRHFTLLLTLPFAVVGSSALSQEAPWIENADISLSGYPIPTTPERLTNADVLMVAAAWLDWDPGNQVWELSVHPWDSLFGCCGGPADPPLCDPTDFFYGQPTPGGICSGFLVGDDLVVTAGHCVAGMPETEPPPYPCTNRYVIFDWADHGPISEEGVVQFDEDQVVQCSEVIVDTHLGATKDLSTAPPVRGAGDWALLKLAEPVDRLPLVLERFPPDRGGGPGPGAPSLIEDPDEG